MKKYKVNVYLILIFTFLILISNFLLYRASSSYLKDDELYGLWLVILSIVTWFYIMDFGLSNSLRNMLTVAKEKNDIPRMRELITTTYLVMLVPLILILIIGIACVTIFDWNNILNTNFQHINAVLMISFILFPLVFYLNTICYIYHAYFKSYIVNIMQFLNLFINCVVLFLLASNEKGSLVLIATVYFTINILIYILFTLHFFYKERALKLFNVKSFDKTLIRPLLSIGIDFFILDITSLLLYNSGPLLINVFFDPYRSVVFQLPYKIFTIYITLSTIILTPLWTLIINKLVANQIDEIKKIHKKLILVIIFFVFLTLTTSFFANEIIYLWIGKAYDIPLNHLFLISSIVVFSLIANVYKTILNSMTILRIQSIIFTIATIVCLVGLFLLKFTETDSMPTFLFVLIIGVAIPALSLPIVFMSRINKVDKDYY